VETRFDVFAATGAFISSVPVDARLAGFRIRGTRVVAIGATDLGEPMVRVYEIVGS